MNNREKEEIMKVYAVICFDYSTLGNRFSEVRIFSTMDKARAFEDSNCNGKICDYAEIVEVEVD